MKRKGFYILILFIGYSPIAEGQILKKLGKKISEVSQEIGEEIKILEQVNCLFTDKDCINKAKKEGKKVIIVGKDNNPSPQSTPTTSAGKDNYGYAVHDEHNSFSSASRHEEYETVNKAFKWSQDGSSIAQLSFEGSRMIVMINGKSGPVADNIFFESLIFSPSGKRHAYLAQFGQDCKVVVDGKIERQLHCPSRSLNLRNISLFHFTEDDTSLLIHNKSKGNYGASDLTIDGKAFEVVFDPVIVRGNGIYFILKNNDGYSHYVNGKLGPTYLNIKGLAVTFDGKHYSYMAQKKENNGGVGYVVVTDGKESPLYKRIESLSMDLRNGKVIYRTDINTVIDDKSIVSKGYLKTVNPIMRYGMPKYMLNSLKNQPMDAQAIFSKDGQRNAYVTGSVDNKMETLWVDGKAMSPFEEIIAQSFTGDGKGFIYVGKTRNKYFVVVEGTEFGPFDYFENLVVSEEGNAYAFIARKSGEINHWYVNGKKIAPAQSSSQVGSRLVFSLDGSRYAFRAQGERNEHSFVIDGEIHNDMLSGFRDPEKEWPPFIFNPTTNKLAYVIKESYEEGKYREVLIYGKDKLAGIDNKSYFGFPTFSNDGKHFAVLMGQQQYGKPTQWKFFIDLKPGPLIGQPTSGKPEFASFVSPNIFRSIGLIGDKLDVHTVSF